MKTNFRRKFLKSVTAASMVSTLGSAALIARAATTASCTGYSALETPPSGTSNTLGIIGDQVTAKFYIKSVTNSIETVKFMSNGYITWAQALSGQKLRIVANQSQAYTMVTGADIDNGFKKQMQDCLAAQVSDIICMGGQQDLVNGISLDTVKTAWLEIIQIAVCANKRIWWLTQTPVDNANDAIRASIYQLNLWIIDQARNFSNVTVIDVAAVVSRLIGSGATAYQQWLDRTRNKDDFYTPINTGAFAIGKAIAQQWNGLPSTFQLASNPLDDIQGDPRSFNIIHNGLMGDIGINRVTDLVGGSGYKGDGNGYFPLIFEGGTGSGAIGRAQVNGSGAVIAVDIQHSGLYTVAPSISFAKGLGGGASATARLGIAGFTHGESVIEAQSERTDKIGVDANLTISYPNYQTKRGLGYHFSMGEELLKHLGANDTFTIQCAVSHVAAQSMLTAAGPYIKCYGGTERTYDSCGDSPDDLPLPAFTDAIFVTPPLAHTDAKNIRFYLYATNDQSWASNAKARVKFGRVSCSVSPSKMIDPVVKDVVKFHPGHYVTVYPDWNYATFQKQDGFNTGIVQGNVTTAAWSGVEKQVRWATIQPTATSYDFSTITDWIDGLRAWNAAHPERNPKRLMLYLLSDSYNNPSPAYLPDHILNGKNSDSDSYYYFHSNGNGKKLKYFDTFVQSQLIALGQALAAEFDAEPLFEGYRMDETSPGNTLVGLHPTRLTDYIEGQIHVAAEVNRAFKQTMFIMGFNFVADQKMSRAARMLVQAGVGMGVVDLVKTDTSLAGPFASYDYIKAASPYVSSVAHFDSGNYWSNTTLPVADLADIITFARARVNASHICWYRNNLVAAPNYWTLTTTLNKLPTDWDSAAGRSYGLSTTRATSLN